MPVLMSILCLRVLISISLSHRHHRNSQQCDSVRAGAPIDHLTLVVLGQLASMFSSFKGGYWFLTSLSDPSSSSPASFSLLKTHMQANSRILNDVPPIPHHVSYFHTSTSLRLALSPLTLCGGPRVSHSAHANARKRTVSRVSTI
ncbi:hypothetical protein M378DRAFT_182149 [Amanita muscaria Koide BX008]|uniref:Secreted protein n=1 Tax=Amanita muscaria (strain Koide BX008) TaxID=946122 RepID=A0A0C2RZC9_AMAMK|nr:hypothetical protein M378DRAFT_182149 [Amanita muscaria Koide BX008]